MIWEKLYYTESLTKKGFWLWQEESIFVPKWQQNPAWPYHFLFEKRAASRTPRVSHPWHHLGPQLRRRKGFWAHSLGNEGETKKARTETHPESIFINVNLFCRKINFPPMVSLQLIWHPHILIITVGCNVHSIKWAINTARVIAAYNS